MIDQTMFFLDNPLQCDCDLLWYKSWLLRAESSVGNDQARPLILKTKCFSEKDKHEYMVKQASSFLSLSF